jgi:hypothetical protein
MKNSIKVSLFREGEDIRDKTGKDPQKQIKIQSCGEASFFPGGGGKLC